MHSNSCYTLISFSISTNTPLHVRLKKTKTVNETLPTLHLALLSDLSCGAALKPYTHHSLSLFSPFPRSLTLTLSLVSSSHIPHPSPPATATSQPHLLPPRIPAVVSMSEIKMDKPVEIDKRPIFRDIRCYFCEYCGICRSKKTLITSHINSHHKEEAEKDRAERNNEAQHVKPDNTCQECGARFKKRAYLLQHMQSHSLEHWIPDKELQNAWGSMFGLDGLVSSRETSCEAPSRMPQSRFAQNERPYVCTIDDCQASYRRKDHLTRHLLQHEGKTFKCPIESCNLNFSLQGNMKRHVKEIHDEESTNVESQKQFVCPEVGCGKVFRFASKLQKHENSHVKLESVGAVCLEPGCMKHFSNDQCLKAHIESCHQHLTCDTCGSKQLKKNIKRHLRTHEAEGSLEVFQCEFKGCSCTFSSKSNLHTHEKAVHFKEKPYVCGFPDCGMRFAYKHVRDNHEKTAKHVFTHGDFEEADEQFRSRPRGGRKRKCPTVEMLVRKRVTPPSQMENWFFMQDSEEMD